MREKGGRIESGFTREEIKVMIFKLEYPYVNKKNQKFTFLACKILNLDGSIVGEKH